MIAPVNKIIDSSVVDGPGNRTSIFFQGCSFNCKYCHNPETINHCINCGKCVDSCPVHALTMENGKVEWDAALCCGCDTCIKVCKHNASPRIMMMRVEQVYQRVMDNVPFIRGITVSGGECTLQHDFVMELFKQVTASGLSALLDSNGSFDFEKHPEILEYCDGVMLDIKAANPQQHLWMTDHSNEMALRNAVYLASRGKLPEIRTVCIPGTLDAKETIRTASELLHPYLDQITYKLIRFRHYGVREEYRCFEEPDDAYMNKLKEYALSCGFTRIILI